MNHLMILPVIIPMLAGAWLLVNHRASIGRQRVWSILSSTMLVALGLWSIIAVREGFLTYWLGNWQPPFGIVLVLDQLSAMMLLLTAVLALLCALYASRGSDREGSHFHALFQFQLMGINGAFLTGDLFNLFVFFEILLLASYALLLHGGGRARSRAGLHYVIINLLGSALFLLALGILYGLTGTLNMADLALKIAAANPDDQTLLTGAAMLLMVVFGIKAAILPLLFWLPRAYSAASAPVAALFAIMTKVGFYAMVRVLLIVFGFDQVHPVNANVFFWLWPLALVTLAIGATGVLGAASLRTMAAYLVILSSGLLMASFAMAEARILAASLFYLLHSTCLAAVFFLLADLIGRQRQDGYDRLSVNAPLSNRWLLGTLFLVSAVSMAGLPPFSGFISKAWLLQNAIGHPPYLWLWGFTLVAGLFMIAALSRAGSGWFWKPEALTGQQRRRLDPARVTTVMVMIGISAGLAAFAEPVMNYMNTTAEQLYQPSVYVEAVLGGAAAAPGGLNP